MEYITLPDATIRRETEKAYLIEVGYSHAVGHGSKTVWFPKSQMKVDGDTVMVARWILSKKEAEISATYNGFYGFHASIIKEAA